MPGAYAHILAAHHMRQALPSLAEGTADYEHVLFLGAQGPDPFFFLGHLPPFRRRDASRSISFGMMLHRQSPELTFGGLLAASHSLEAEYQAPQARSLVLRTYLAGFLSHYLLDRVVHPFVYWMSGFDRHGSLSFPWIGRHTRFETQMDLALAQDDRPPALTRPLHHLLGQTFDGHPFPARELAWIAELYQRAFPGEDGGTLFATAARDMARIKRLVTDPLGIKTAIVSMFASTDFVLRSMLRTARVELYTARMALNEDGTPWCDPVSGSPSTLSVRALLHQAVTDFVRLYPAVLAPCPPARVNLEILGTINFEGHRPEDLKGWHRGLAPEEDSAPGLALGNQG